MLAAACVLMATLERGECGQIVEPLVGVTRDAICRWIGRRNLSAHGFGRRRTFKVSAVDDRVCEDAASEHKDQD